MLAGGDDAIYHQESVYGLPPPPPTEDAMKRNTTDALFSRYIRERDGWRCQKCRKDYSAPERHQFLHCAHMLSRGKRRVRFDVYNAYSLCYGCHRWLDTHPDVKERWARKKMGDERYNALLVRARFTQKIDELLIRKWLKHEIDQLGTI